MSKSAIDRSRLCRSSGPVLCGAAALAWLATGCVGSSTNESAEESAEDSGDSGSEPVPLPDTAVKVVGEKYELSMVPDKAGLPKDAFVVSGHNGFAIYVPGGTAPLVDLTLDDFLDCEGSEACVVWGVEATEVSTDAGPALEFASYGPSGSVNLRRWDAANKSLPLFGQVLPVEPIPFFDVLALPAASQYRLVASTTTGLDAFLYTDGWQFQELGFSYDEALGTKLVSVALQRPDLLVGVFEALSAEGSRVGVVDLSASSPTWMDVGPIGDTAAAIVPMECANAVCGVASPGTGMFRSIVTDSGTASGFRLGNAMAIGGLPLGCSATEASDGATFFCTSADDDRVTRLEVAADGSTTATPLQLTDCTEPVGVAAVGPKSALVGCKENVIRGVAFD